MAALTADRNVRFRKTGRIVNVPLAANAVVYVGSFVSVYLAAGAAPGYGKATADAANETFMGVAIQAGNNTGGADGAVSVDVLVGPVVNCGINTLAQANVGITVYASDDNSVEDAATTTNDVEIGRLEGVDPDTGEAIVACKDPA